MRVIVVFTLVAAAMAADGELYRYIEKTATDMERMKLLKDHLQKITAAVTRKNNRDLVILLREEGEDTVLTNVNYPIVIVKEDKLFNGVRHAREREIAYVFSTKPIAKVLRSISWDSKTRFVVICPSARDAEAIFQEFWDERNVNVVALVYEESKRKMAVLTFYPYTEKHCGAVKLAELTRWNTSKAIFQPKMEDMKRCDLSITLLLRPPFVILGPDQQITGLEIEILRSVAAKLNATPVFEMLHLKGSYIQRRSGNTLMQELTDNHCDIVAGALMFTRSVSFNSEGISYPESICVAMAVPRRHQRVKVNLWYFTDKFSRIFLYSLIVMVLVCTVFLYFVLKMKRLNASLSRCLWLIVYPLVGGAIRVWPNGAVRCFFTLWIWASFLCCKHFEGTVSSSVMIQSPVPQLESIQEVLRTELFVQGETFLMTEILSKYIDKGVKANVSYNSVSAPEALASMHQDHRVAFLGTTINIQYFWSREVEEDVYIQPQCLTSYTPVVQTRKNSPLHYVLTKHIRALAEFGIIRKMVRSYNHEYLARKERESLGHDVDALALSHLSGAFLLWLAGLLVALLVFLLELCVSCSKRRCYGERDRGSQ